MAHSRVSTTLQVPLPAPQRSACSTLASQDPATAFCESAIHENSLFLNGTYVASKAGPVARSLVGFKHPTKPSLTLAHLTGAGLKTLGLKTTSPPATTTASRRSGQRPSTSRALIWTASATSAGSATVPSATSCLTVAVSSPTELRPCRPPCSTRSACGSTCASSPSRSACSLPLGAPSRQPQAANLQ